METEGLAEIYDAKVYFIYSDLKGNQGDGSCRFFLAGNGVGDIRKNITKIIHESLKSKYGFVRVGFVNTHMTSRTSEEYVEMSEGNKDLESIIMQKMHEYM